MKTKRVLKRILITVFAVLLYFFFSAGIAMLLGGHVLSNPTILSVKIIDVEYNNKICDAVYKTLDGKMKLVVLSSDDISGVLTREVITCEAANALDYTISSLFGKTDIPEYTFKSDALRDVISEKLNAYAKENDIEYADDSVDKVYGMICQTVTDELRVIPSSYTQKIGGAVQKLANVMRYGYYPLIVAAVCAAGIIITGRRHMRSAFYNATLPLFLSSFTLFSVSSILLRKDYLSKTILDDGVLQYIIRRLQNLILGDIKQATTYLSLAFLVIGLTISVVLAIHRSKKRATDYGHTHR